MQGRLPAQAQEILKKAAKTPVTRADPLARIKAMEKADQRVKTLFPQYFRK
jgi:hypothetical protein